MGLKQWLKTRWNGDNRHKNELNTDKNMANSSKHKTTAFEIQTRDECSSPPPNSKGLIYGYTCSRLPSAPRTNALSCLYIVTRKKGFFNWPWETPYYCTGTYNPETAIIFKSVGKVPTFHLFFNPFSPSTLKHMCVSCRSCDDTLEKVCLFQYHLIYMHIYPLFNEKKKGLIPLES